jgi:hypothetical protein
VFEVHADARPRPVSTTHRVDEHIRGLEQRRDFGMLRLPTLQPLERLGFVLRAPDLDHRFRRCATPGASGAFRSRRLHPRWLAILLLIVRWPRRIAEPRGLLSRGQLEECIEGAGVLVDGSVHVAETREASGHRAQREVFRPSRIEFVPRHGRRDARVDLRADRVRTRHGPILRVLVVIEKDAVPFFLPPLARRDRRRAPLDLAREREGRASNLRKLPSPFDPHVHMDAARSRCLRPSDETEVREGLAHDARDRDDLRPLHAGNGVEVDPQFVGVLEVVGAHRMRVQFDATEVRHPHERGGIARDDFERGATRGEREFDGVDPIGPGVGRALLEEEVAVDPIEVAHEHVRTTARAAKRAIGDGDEVVRDIELRDPRLGEIQLRRVRERDEASGGLDLDALGLARHRVRG